MIAGELVAESMEFAREGHCCRACFERIKPTYPGSNFPFRLMIVCPDCGNKRCPKATNHDNACTGSNATGQPGSKYENWHASRKEAK